MRLLPIVLCLAVTGCSSWRFSLIPSSSIVEEPVSSKVAGDLLQPERSIGQIMVSRLKTCQQPESQRKGLATASAGGGNDNALGNLEGKLDAMLAASCQPADNFRVLNQLLAELTSAGSWPEEYAAFFDLLIAAQQAFSGVDKAYKALKIEHENTIQGLSEIEADLELQNSALQNRKRDL